jgi:hypothetical protein
VSIPSTVADTFAAAGLAPEGVVRWGKPIPEPQAGVYVVSLVKDVGTAAGAVADCPLSTDALDELLAVRPELCVDKQRPTRDELGARLARMWLADEVVVYIGLAGTSLRGRVGDYYSTPLGARRPHAGGWPLKTLRVLDELWVHYARSADPDGDEKLMLKAFVDNLTPAVRVALIDPDLPVPFANLELRKGQRQRHGISGAREPRKKKPVVAASTAPAPGPSASTSAPARGGGASVSGTALSQPLRPSDLASGRVRFAAAAKPAFPAAAGELDIVLRGVPVTARWNPRLGPDRERSGTLLVGRDLLANHVSLGDILAASKRDDGAVELT